MSAVALASWARTGVAVAAAESISQRDRER